MSGPKLTGMAGVPEMAQGEGGRGEGKKGGQGSPAATNIFLNQGPSLYHNRHLTKIYMANEVWGRQLGLLLVYWHNAHLFNRYLGTTMCHEPSTGRTLGIQWYFGAEMLQCCAQGLTIQQERQASERVITEKCGSGGLWELLVEKADSEAGKARKSSLGQNCLMKELLTLWMSQEQEKGT